MTTEQKLREALRKAKAALSLALSDVDWRKDSLTQPVIHKAYNCAHEALALPTAAPNTPLEQDAASILFALRDAWPYVHKSCTIDSIKNRITHLMRKHGDFADVFPQVDTQKTAAPVCEREAFEREMSKPPFEFCMDRWPDDGSYAWPGNYAAYHTQCAWAAWQARAALIAGDAVDAQRYRWLMDNCTLGIKQNGVGWSLNTSACVAPDCIKDVGAAIDAAMRKDKP